MEENKRIFPLSPLQDSKDLKESAVLLKEELDAFKALAKGSSMTRVLAKLCSTIESQLLEAFCSIVLIDSESGKVNLGASPSLPVTFTMKLVEKGLLFEVIESKKLVVLKDVEEKIKNRDKRTNIEINTIWLLPVVSEDEMVGVLCISQQTSNQLSKALLERLSYFSKTFGLIITKYRRDQQSKMLDRLTGLPNRDYLYSKINRHIEQVMTVNESFAFLYIDCDRFTMLNGSFGQQVGDMILKKLAQELHHFIGENGILSRIDSDEFVLFCTYKEAADIKRKVEGIFSIFKKPWHINDHKFPLTVSIGISEYPIDGLNVHSLLEKAELALKQAKKEGLNQAVYYQESQQHINYSRQIVLENDLRSAIERDEFALYYQPQVNVRTKQIEGVEALLRWEHPEFGVVSPAEFIPILEDTDLIIPLGEVILIKACMQQMEWVKKGLPPVTVSVNISPVQFKPGIIINAVKKAIRKSGIKPQFLNLEITEGMLIHNVKETHCILTTLNEMGIRVAIDDFGTGYSSLSYLKQFPIKTIKIDRSFVKDIVMDNQDRAIVKAIIEMGKSLNMDLVAEGVENVQQVKVLKDEGCHFLQGFYFSKPMSNREVEQQLQRWIDLKESIKWE